MPVRQARSEIACSRYLADDDQVSEVWLHALNGPHERSVEIRVVRDQLYQCQSVTSFSVSVTGLLFAP